MSYSDRLLAQLNRRSYVPAPAAAIAKEWRLNPKDRRKFNQQVAELLQSGRLVLIKGDRLCLPREADLVTGTINFRQKGSAMVFPEVKVTEPRKPGIFISPEDTGVALQGDKVVVRLRSPKDRDFPHFLKPGEHAGKVIKIIERGSATLTGTLQRGRNYFYVASDDPRIGHDIIVQDPGQGPAETARRCRRQGRRQAQRVEGAPPESRRRHHRETRPRPRAPRRARRHLPQIQPRHRLPRRRRARGRLPPRRRRPR